MRLTLDQYAQHFKMSKEMIHSKIKAKKLNYIIENGVTYLIVTEQPQTAIQPQEATKPATKPKELPDKAPARAKPTVAMIIGLYQKENKQLKEKIIQLEEKIDKLIADKEQMLRDERDRIEQVYSAKDEQLKNILELINSKLLLEHSANQTIHEVETYEDEKADEPDEEESALDEDLQSSEYHYKAPNPHATLGLVELRDYLKTLDLKSYQRKIIKRRFLAVYDSDVRILQQNGKLYLDFSRYDYTDLLSY